MDEAAALRAQVWRLQARLAENSPERPIPAPRGLPNALVERGAIPQPEPVDCADGEAPARFGLRRGPLRRGRQPKRLRKAVTYLFPRLPSADPDFTGEPSPSAWTLQNPFWVFAPPMTPAPSCDAVRFGSESAPSAWFSIAGFDASNAVCVGRVETLFDAPGVPGGGFEFRASNGCSCMVPAVVPRTVGGTIGWDDSAPCYQGNVGLTGVHDAPRT